MVKKTLLRNKSGRFISHKSKPTTPTTPKTLLRDKSSRFISHKSKPTTPTTPKTLLRDKSGRFISHKSKPTTPTTPQPTTPTTPQPTTPQPTTPIIPKVSTSKTQQKKSQITTKTGKIGVFTQNITFDLKPKVDSKSFGFKIPYLVRRVISQYHKYQFNKNTIVNIKSGSVMMDSTNNRLTIGDNTSNHKCSDFITFTSLVELIFKLIKNSAYTSHFYIEFIDLTVTIYQF